MQTCRTGPVGALMDECERAAGEFLALLDGLSDEDYELTSDTTTDQDCGSTRIVAVRVLRSGYGYAGMLRKAWAIGPAAERPERLARREAEAKMRKMLAYTSATLDGRWQIPEAGATSLPIRSSWGSVCDLEQLLEHPIVHILRHRRQVKRFLNRQREHGGSA